MFATSNQLGNRTRLWLIILYLSFALSLTIYHSLAINRQFWVQRMEYHQQIVSGEFKSPYQYRVLATFGAEFGGRILEEILGLQSGKSAYLARETLYVVMRFFATAATLIFFHKYLENWLTLELAFGGTILFFALHIYTFRSYFYQPSSFLHLLFLTVGVYIILNKQDIWLFPLIFVASLSRETSGLLILFYIANNWNKSGVLKALVLLVPWLLGQAIPRLIFGLVPSVNMRPISENLYYYNLPWPIFLFGIMWLIPILYSKHLPNFLRRALFLVTPPLIIVNLIFGKIEETRLLLELALIFIPSTYLFLFPSSSVRELSKNSILSDHGIGEREEIV